jgi:two-component system response regulator RegA
MPSFEDLPLALVVDDDEVFRLRLCRALAERNWAAEAAADGEAALKFARDRSPDLVLVDLRMPGMGGLDVVQELRAIDDRLWQHPHGDFRVEARRRPLFEQTG